MTIEFVFFNIIIYLLLNSWSLGILQMDLDITLSAITEIFMYEVNNDRRLNI